MPARRAAATANRNASFTPARGITTNCRFSLTTSRHGFLLGTSLGEPPLFGPLVVPVAATSAVRKGRPKGSGVRISIVCLLCKASHDDRFQVGGNHGPEV